MDGSLSIDLSAYATKEWVAAQYPDLRGFDQSSLTSLQYTFSGCTALTTILADAGWALPFTVSGLQAFYNSKVLVGGNGTAWSSSNVSYKCCVVDAAGSPGYLTAG